jgi:hypothetical protein
MVTVGGLQDNFLILTKNYSGLTSRVRWKIGGVPTNIFPSHNRE